MTPPTGTLAPPARRTSGGGRSPAARRAPVGDRRAATRAAPAQAGRRRASVQPAAPSRHRSGPGRHHRRLLWFLAVVVALFTLVVSKLADLQVLNPDHYRAFGASQRTFSQTIAADRGIIYDRNGVELVMSRPATSVFVDPALVEDPVAEAAELAPVLGLDPARVEALMRGEGRFAYLARKVPPEVVEQVRALALPGVAFLTEPERHRPSGDLARAVLGEVDVDNVGISGLELLYGDELTGTPGELVLERDPAGRTIAMGEHQLVPAVKGDDLILTLDRSLQFEVERVLAEQVARTEARGGIAVVSRPDTGEVLAMANMVRDPESDRIVPGTNAAALTATYEPGSVMKMVTVAGAIERGVVTPDTVISVPPSLRIADARFTDAEPHGGAEWTVTEVLAHSSNIGTIKIAQQLGRQPLYDTLRAFGFGERTAIGFPNEQAGAVPPPEQWWDTSMGTIPIGHGVSATPLQVLAAYNVIANDGVYVPPRLVAARVDADGVAHRPPVPSGRRVVSERTARELNRMLREVVADGTGRRAAVGGYTPAGKTGTSRKQFGGGYVDADGVVRYQSTFVGFVPAERPALSIIVIIDDPRSGEYTGGMVSAPAFSSIASYALRLLGIPPPLTDVASDGAAVVRSPDELVEPFTRTADGRIRALPAEMPPPPQPVPQQHRTGGEAPAASGGPR